MVGLISAANSEGGKAGLVISDPGDLPGQIWSRVNVRLDRNQGGQGHAQETVYARRDYSTSANG